MGLSVSMVQLPSLAREPAERNLSLGAQIITSKIEQLPFCRWNRPEYSKVILLSFFWVSQFYALLPWLRRLKIPLHSTDRSDEHPIVIAGGIGVNNPLPLAPFIDVFVLGDGEDAIVELLTLAYQLNRNEFLFAAHEAGYYVPMLHRGENIYARFSRDICTSLHYPIYSLSGRVRQIEIARGCANKCRFCTIAWTKRPYREAPVDAVIREIHGEETKEINLFAPNGAGHSGYKKMYEALSKAEKRLTSCDARLDDVEKIKYVPGTMFNLGIDGCSQRLRNAIGKNLTTEQIIKSICYLAEQGCRNIKLYLIVDLPGETPSDQDEFYDTLEEIGKTVKTNDFSIQIINTSFNPLPHTPLQWAPIERKKENRDHWRDLFRKRGKFKMPFKLARTRRASDVSYLLAAMLLRGGHEMAAVLEKIALNQKKYLRQAKPFYGGMEDILELLEQYGISNIFEKRDENKVLPWGFINYPMITKNRLKFEFKKYGGGNQ